MLDNACIQRYAAQQLSHSAAFIIGENSMPTSSYSMSVRDYSRELASFQFPITEVTAGNLPGLLVLGGNL